MIDQDNDYVTMCEHRQNVNTVKSQITLHAPLPASERAPSLALFLL